MRLLETTQKRLERNTVRPLNNEGLEGKKPRLFTVDESNRRTPSIVEGAVVTLGTAPDAIPHTQRVDGLVKVEFPGLAGQLSRQAIQIGVFDGFPRIRSMTENNKVTVWSTDQGQPLSANAELNKPLGDQVWSKLGKHISADIETADGTLVRLRFASGGGGGKNSEVGFAVEVNPDTARDRVPVEDFISLN